MFSDTSFLGKKIQKVQNELICKIIILVWLKQSNYFQNLSYKIFQTLNYEFEVFITYCRDLNVSSDGVSRAKVRAGGKCLLPEAA